MIKSIIIAILLFSYSAFSLSYFNIFNPSSVLSQEQSLGMWNFIDGNKELILYSASDLKGHELNTEQRKSIQIINTGIEQLMEKYSIKIEDLNDIFNMPNGNISDYLFVANLMHSFVKKNKAKKWLAIFPNNFSVNKVIYQIEWFHQGYGGHSQLRFQLNNKILLLDQFKAENSNWKEKFVNSENNKLLTMNTKNVLSMLIPGDIVLTLNAVRVNDGPTQWDPLMGLLGTYANAYSFLSTSHIADVAKDKNKIEQMELELTDTQKRDIFLYSLQYSNKYQEKQIYNSIFNSCITASFEFLYADGYGIKISSDVFNPYLVKEHLNNNVSYHNISELNAEYFAYNLDQVKKEYKSTEAFINSNLHILKSKTFNDIAREIAFSMNELNWDYKLSLQFLKDLKDINEGSNVDVIISMLQNNYLLSETDKSILFDLVNRIKLILKRDNQTWKPEYIAFLRQFRSFELQNN